MEWGVGERPVIVSNTPREILHPAGKRGVQDDVFILWAAPPGPLSHVSLEYAKFAGICYLLGFVSVNRIYSQ